ncbi:MAG: AAA family ATPase [Candidatus Dormibacteraeota bacterium]|nr:AAA family ATPase [Candidatus Dormibacteraeota bacterium]
MRGVRIPHDLNGEDQFVLGLSVPRFAALLLGLLAAYTILHLSLPAPLQLAAAGTAGLAGAAVAWIRPEGRSLLHWVLAALEFKFGQEMAPDLEPTQGAQVKPSTGQDRQLIGGRGPRLSVVTSQAESTPAQEPSPATLAHFADDDVIELPDPGAGMGHDADGAIDVEATEPAPVYLGGPQVITFFSAKGGTGRTTLATEVAALLAIKGRYRESPTGPRQSLRVVLVDFDLASANVSARLGIAQPTMLDYLSDLTVPHPDPRDYIVRHQATGLDVLLGPSKCLAGDRAELFGVPQAAHILSTLKAAGYQFLVLDMSAALGGLETYLLETATRIYCVVTPTAGSVQALYRGVEALRRLGLGTKLQYVANKMRDGFSLSEPMGDLNGSLVARIPYDAAFDTAENRHEPLVLRGAGASNDALRRLAASVYPALHLPTPSGSRSRSFAWLSRGRRAG